MRKKVVIIILIGVIILFSGYIIEKKFMDPGIEDIEAYCTSFGEMCSQDSQNKNLCEFCGVTQASSYASCHSKEFCNNAPME